MKNTTLSCGFDALIIAGKEKAHDSSIVDGVVPGRVRIFDGNVFGGL